jgi:hypothetical protein
MMFRTARCWVRPVVSFAFILGTALIYSLSPQAVAAASAQTTLNQTTCVSDTGNCAPSGFVQDLAVTCGPSVEGKVNTWLARITDRSAQNRITVSGTCNEFVSIIGFNRLTIQSNSGALIRNVFVGNSRIITLKALNIGQNAGNGIQMSASTVTLDGVTVQGAGSNGIFLGALSVLSFAGAPSSVIQNAFAGIRAAGASQVNLSNVTVSNNGTGSIQGLLEKSGVAATQASTVVLSNLNGAVDIAGNPRAGMYLDRATLEMGPSNPSTPMTIHNNGEVGLQLDVAHASLSGTGVTINANGSGGSQVFVVGGVVSLSGGMHVQGDVSGVMQASVVVGSGDAAEGSGGPIAMAGTLALGGGSVAVLRNANSFTGVTCDSTSWMDTDGLSTSGSNTCPNTPQVTVTAGTGLSGGGPVPLGGSITLQNTGVLSVLTSGPVLSTGGQNPVIGLAPNYFIQNGTAAQGNASFNVSGSGTVGGTLTAGGNAFKADTSGVTIGSGGTPIVQHVSATFDIAVPSLKPNTCANVTNTFTAVGSGTNDTIALGIPSAFMNAGGSLMFNAWESGPNILTIRVCNVSPNGPAASAVSGTIRVDLFKH